MSQYFDLTTQSASVAMLSLLNGYLNTTYTADSITFGPMSAVNGNPSVMTCDITFAGGPLSGTRNVQWSRLNLDVYGRFQPVALPAPKYLGVPLESTKDLAAAITNQTDLVLLEEDIVDVPLNVSEWTYPHVINVTVQPDNFAYYGTMSVTIESNGTIPAKIYVGLAPTSFTVTTNNFTTYNHVDDEEAAQFEEDYSEFDAIAFSSYENRGYGVSAEYYGNSYEAPQGSTVNLTTDGGVSWVKKFFPSVNLYGSLGWFPKWATFFKGAVYCRTSTHSRYLWKGSNTASFFTRLFKNTVMRIDVTNDDPATWNAAPCFEFFAARHIEDGNRSVIRCSFSNDENTLVVWHSVAVWLSSMPFAYLITEQHLLQRVENYHYTSDHNTWNSGWIRSMESGVAKNFNVLAAVLYNNHLFAVGERGLAIDGHPAQKFIFTWTNAVDSDVWTTEFDLPVADLESVGRLELEIDYTGSEPALLLVVGMCQAGGVTTSPVFRKPVSNPSAPWTMVMTDIDTTWPMVVTGPHATMVGFYPEDIAFVKPESAYFTVTQDGFATTAKMRNENALWQTYMNDVWGRPPVLLSPSVAAPTVPFIVPPAPTAPTSKFWNFSLDNFECGQGASPAYEFETYGYRRALTLSNGDVFLYGDMSGHLATYEPHVSHYSGILFSTTTLNPVDSTHLAFASITQLPPTTYIQCFDVTNESLIGVLGDFTSVRSPATGLPIARNGLAYMSYNGSIHNAAVSLETLQPYSGALKYEGAFLQYNQTIGQNTNLYLFGNQYDSLSGHITRGITRYTDKFAGTIDTGFDTSHFSPNGDDKFNVTFVKVVDRCGVWVSGEYNYDRALLLNLDGTVNSSLNLGVGSKVHALRGIAQSVNSGHFIIFGKNLGLPGQPVGDIICVERTSVTTWVQRWAITTNGHVNAYVDRDSNFIAGGDFTQFTDASGTTYSVRHLAGFNTSGIYQPNEVTLQPDGPVEQLEYVFGYENKRIACGQFRTVQKYPAPLYGYENANKIFGF